MNLVKSAVLIIVTAAMLWHQIGFARAEGVHDLPGSSWRFWDDMTLAIARFVDRGSERREDGGSGLSALVETFRGLVEDKLRNHGVAPHQFWRTVPDRQFQNQLRAFSEPPNEDPGRSLLLLGGFRLVGGVAPNLLLWIGYFAFIPAFAWLMHECVSNGLSVTAAVVATLVSLSPYWYECISLPHSALGFYLLGVVALAAFAIAVMLRAPGRPLGRRGVVSRSLIMTFFLILAMWCRSGAVFFVPAATLVAAVGFWRTGLTRGPALALAGALVFAPPLILRPHQTHNIWLPFWEGLGDFGQDRGYSWYDRDAGRFLATKGRPLRAELRYVTAEDEVIFRRDFLNQVTSSPGWYVNVLAQRVVATLGLTHLDPYGPRDGKSRRSPLFHYKYSTPIDWFGWRERLYEVPVSVLYIPTLLLGVTAFFRRGRAGGEAAVLGTVAFATLPVPILISTASGLETQTFAFVYFLGAAFLVQRAADRLTGKLTHA